MAKSLVRKIFPLKKIGVKFPLKKTLKHIKMHVALSQTRAPSPPPHPLLPISPIFNQLLKSLSPYRCAIIVRFCRCTATRRTRVPWWLCAHSASTLAHGGSRLRLEMNFFPKRCGWEGKNNDTTSMCSMCWEGFGATTTMLSRIWELMAMKSGGGKRNGYARSNDKDSMSGGQNQRPTHMQLLNPMNMWWTQLQHMLSQVCSFFSLVLWKGGKKGKCQWQDF